MKDVVLPPIRGVDKGDYLHVSFERGTHSSDTKEVKLDDVSGVGDIKIPFNETLKLEVTLYRDGSGNYQVSILYSMK